MQEEIIAAALRGEDSLVIMPTGGGKSVCFQVPAMLLDGLTIVVSPLISLMKDQVDGLREVGIPAAALNSNQTLEENVRIENDCLSGRTKLLYVSPETLVGRLPYFANALQISLIAVDEAHCISQWGHDFRPEYTQLDAVRQALPNVPIMALTATADRVTRADICKQLQLREPHVFLASFDRPNLSLTVIQGFNEAEKSKALLRFIGAHVGQSGIVYCLAKKTTEKVAEKLAAKGLRVGVYHAGKSSAERNAVQQAFADDSIQIVVATIAFGMGIDKSNVRWIVHYNLPKSIENYYQEIGRAGRDGDPADTLLFYNVSDIIKLEHFVRESGQREVEEEKLQRMRDYAEARICRRKILLNYFGENRQDDCHNCDVCRNPPRLFDGTTLAQKALSAIARCNEQITMRTAVDILFGKYSPTIAANHYDQIKTFGCGHDVPLMHWNKYMLQFLMQGLFDMAYDEENHLKITAFGKDVLYGRARIELAEISAPQPVERKPKKTARKSTRPLFEAETTEAAFDPELFERLKTLRLTLANAQGLPAYVVFTDKVLRALATLKPKTLEEFGRIPGIGEFKQKKYGATFLELILER